MADRIPTAAPVHSGRGSGERRRRTRETAPRLEAGADLLCELQEQTEALSRIGLELTPMLRAGIKAADNQADLVERMELAATKMRGVADDAIASGTRNANAMVSALDRLVVQMGGTIEEEDST